MGAISQRLDELLKESVHQRTGRRVTGLAVELVQETVVLRGRTGSYYVKQLAQQGVRDVLPQNPLQNAIVVA
ncbi:hypothetical protein FRUB_06966 [Fimbriiglobus ruber]|uniref:Uncharacterized protein n=2 Tax=Fimbriiglobus ruber TaxID=1908690 RepID=A0A225DK79_9BACT|nr:hypothetical protein FRUB_06966 [Fimbriiglobus ruber]